MRSHSGEYQYSASIKWVPSAITSNGIACWNLVRHYTLSGPEAFRRGSYVAHSMCREYWLWLYGVRITFLHIRLYASLLRCKYHSFCVSVDSKEIPLDDFYEMKKVCFFLNKYAPTSFSDIPNEHLLKISVYKFEAISHHLSKYIISLTRNLTWLYIISLTTNLTWLIHFVSILC